MTNVVTADQWGPTSRQPRRTYAEVYKRHRVLATLPMVVAVLISGYYLMKSGQSYTSTASMWVDAPVPATSTVLAPDPTGWVSTNTASVLKEALSSQSFMVGVAAEMHLAPGLGPVALESLAKGVSSGAPGPQLLTVSASKSSPTQAVAVANAVADQFSRFVAVTLTQRGQSTVAYDKNALDSAAAAVSAASAQVQTYNRIHPSAATDPADATEVQLARKVAEAQTQYTAAQQTYATAQQAASQTISAALQNADVSGVPRVLDKATSAYRASRKKTFIYGGLGGLLGGATVTAMVLAILMNADKSVRTESDVEDTLALRVVGSVDDVRRRRWPLRRSS